jgi:Fungal specific transcription factor domain
MSPATSPFSERGSSDVHSLQNEIDSLLGCAGELFPLIARMSKVSNHLTEKVITMEEIPYIEEAIQIRDELKVWVPPDTDILNRSEDIHCSVEDIVATAETYRLTALLHLYRAFPPLGKDIDRMADEILNRLLLIPKTSGSLCIHIWPLMASGCEHTDPTKRDEVRSRFEDIRQKLMVANVDSAIQLLEEVWRRRDGGDMNVGWASLARERGWHLLLG